MKGELVTMLVSHAQAHGFRLARIDSEIALSCGERICAALLQYN